MTRRAGWQAWLPVSGDFERGLAAQQSADVAGPHIDAETRRGRDYVRVTVAMTVAAADVAEALSVAWHAFRQATSDDPGGWDLASAAAETNPANR
ncbi:MAG TPA: hypothetical protein VG164_06215 [Trebonia sp.]|nr:hypothetical protein [Trebonia sp.]